MRFAKGQGGNPARQFRPGQSGDPGGRPKRKLITHAYLELLAQADLRSEKTLARLIAEEVIKKARKGDLAAVREVTDRVEGKAIQPKDHAGGVQVIFGGRG